MAVKLVLLHSPLAGPGSWRALAPLLRARGFDVDIPDYSDVMAGNPPYYSTIATIVCAAIANTNPTDTILVAHSGAGALIPAIAEGGLASGAIFMDALLPHPGRSWFATAPDALKSRLIHLARDGRVPPWHRWWPKGAIEPLFNDPVAYERFASELNDLPLVYFDEPAPTIELPQALACAYLQLGAGYEAEAGVAEKRGWPVVRLSLHHLAMLTHAEEVAAQVELLVRSLASHAAPA
jgi:alpha/beta hydrolase family protein